MMKLNPDTISATQHASMNLLLGLLIFFMRNIVKCLFTSLKIAPKIPANTAIIIKNPNSQISYEAIPLKSPKVRRPGLLSYPNLLAPVKKRDEKVD